MPTELGNGAIAIEADVTNRDSIVAAAERVQQELGGADILVNNVGVMLTAPFTSDQREEHRRMVETNLLDAMTATEVFLDQLRANGGDLVNIPSVAGRVAPAGFAAYAATKWGINGWSDAFDGRTFDTIGEGMAFAREAGFGALAERGVAAAGGIGPVALAPGIRPRRCGIAHRARADVPRHGPRRREELKKPIGAARANRLEPENPHRKRRAAALQLEVPPLELAEIDAR